MTQHVRIIITALVATLGGAATSAIAGEGDGFWNAITSLPGTRHETCGAVAYGDLYVIGDYNWSDHHDSVLAYEPLTDSWRSCAPMPTGRGQAAAAECEGSIYVFGGNDEISNHWLNTTEAYDPIGDSWQTGLPDLPGTSRGHLSAVTIDDRIYVMGGDNSYVADSFDYNAIYDPASNTWQMGAGLPNRRCHHAAVGFGGKVYLFGGYAFEGGVQRSVSEVDVYDPQTDTWTSAAPIPTPRRGLMTTVFNGRIYAIGGFLGLTNEVTTIVEEYDPVLDCWQQATPLDSPVARGAVGVLDNRIIVAGGAIGDGGGSWNGTDACWAGYPARLPSCLGDLNQDGIVDQADLAILLAHFGQTCP